MGSSAVVPYVDGRTGCDHIFVRARYVRAVTRLPGSIKRAFWVLLAAMAIPIVPFAVIGELPGERWLALSEGDALRFGAFGAFLLALDVLLPIPSSIIGTLLGGRLGFVAGCAWTWLGLTTGLLIGYALGRLVPARFASELPRAPTLGLVFVSRPVPVFAEAVAIAAGVERLKFPQFFAAGACGNAVYALVLNADGAALLPSAGVLPALIVPMLLPVLAYGLWKKISARRA